MPAERGPSGTGHDTRGEELRKRRLPLFREVAALCREQGITISQALSEFQEVALTPDPPVAVPGPASERRTRRSFSDRELTQLQETGSVVVGHSMVDGVRLSAIMAALLLLGIEPDAVVLHGTGADHIAVTVKPDA